MPMQPLTQSVTSNTILAKTDRATNVELALSILHTHKANMHNMHQHRSQSKHRRIGTC